MNRVRIAICFGGVLFLVLSGFAAERSDAEMDSDDDFGEITAMLHTFLAGAGDANEHERFWADDLVYTSSEGTRR